MLTTLDLSFIILRLSPCLNLTYQERTRIVRSNRSQL